MNLLQKLNIKQRILLVVVMIIVGTMLVLHASRGADDRRHKAAITVVVAKAEKSNVPVTLTALGTVIPDDVITVRTQINGQLRRVLFTEGQTVKAGQLIAEIDPRLYQAQLMQYQGQWQRDRAILANAKLDLKRYKLLWSQDSVSKQTLDTQVALVQQDEGTVKLDEGLVNATKVNLAYCYITAPVSGRIGLSLVDAGNFVQISDANGLAVIATLNPISVQFSIPEDNLPEVMQQMMRKKSLPVTAYNRAQTKLLATGKLEIIDNQIDTTTGTVKLKAEFKNDDNILFPNQFVNIHLLVNTINNAIVIPTAAISHGVEGTFVFLLQPDNTVRVTPVTVGVAVGERTMIIKGLTLGQQVVTEGADKLNDGTAVTVAVPKATASHQSALDNSKRRKTA